MTPEQRKKIVELSLASRKASEVYGMVRATYKPGDKLPIHEQNAEDAYAALMAAIWEVADEIERKSKIRLIKAIEFLETPVKLMGYPTI